MHTLTRFHVTSPKAKESRKFLSLSGILKEKISFKLFYNSFTNIPDAETIKLHWYTKQICYCPVFLHWAEVQWNSCSKGLCLFFTLGRQPYPVRYLDNQFRLRSVWQCIQMFCFGHAKVIEPLLVGECRFYDLEPKICAGQCPLNIFALQNCKPARTQ